MGRLTVGALRAVLVVALAGTVLVQALMVWALVSGSDPQDRSLPLITLRELGLGGEAAWLHHRYRHGYPEPAIDVLVALGFSAQPRRLPCISAGLVMKSPGLRADARVALVSGLRALRKRETGGSRRCWRLARPAEASPRHLPTPGTGR